MKRSGSSRYIYIMGRGHSGSTVLDALLGNADNTVGVGELIAGIDGTYSCSCGDPFGECPFWSQVRSVFDQKSDSHWREAIELVTRESKVTRYPVNLVVAGKSNRVRALIGANRELWKAVATVSGDENLVESSKELSRGLFLARFLAEARVIHLVRSPTRMLASNLYRLRSGIGFRFLRTTFYSSTFAPIILAISALSWAFGNLLCELVSSVSSHRVIRVRYEDLCANPAEELKRIARFTGIDVSGVIEAIESGDPLPIEHKLAGNKMAKKGEFIFEPRRSKGRNLPGWLKWIGIFLTWPLLKYYGYEIDEQE